RLLLAWALSALALLVAAAIVPGAVVHDYRSALVAAAAIAVLNAVLPPLVAAIRLPFMALLGFFVVLALDAPILLAADHLTDGHLTVSSFWSALGVALPAAAGGVVLNVVLGTTAAAAYASRVTQPPPRRSDPRAPARAAAASSPARPTTSSSRPAAARLSGTRTPATARSSPTGSTSCARSSCSGGR